MAKVKRTLASNLPYILIVCGLVIALAALALSIDKIKLLENPNYHPICDLNPVVSCGSVIDSKQGTAFGFPNPFVGLFAGGIVLAAGMAMVAGAKFKRWFWVGLELGTLFGMGFIGWLFFQTLYRINALCPYCISVWVATITAFWYLSLYNIDQKNIRLPKKLLKPYGWVRKHHFDLLILFFIIITAVILNHFWYYYGKYF
ncbi:MAG TPA: vitamin K epoxide reductase family protein [Candidatus Saccharimonadales bacterium]|jgi:uncharacterized membrane protein